MSPECEGPGCVRPAKWQRATTLVVNIERYLCEVHYSELRSERPSTAAHYVPLIQTPDEPARTP